MLKTVGNPATRYGDQTVVDGNLVIGTAGKGIDFSATSSGTGTMTSELLSDYEEGTFTPTIVGSVSAGVGTYSYQVGRYTKIGNRVFFNIYIDWSAHTGSGFMRIAGLPFTSQAAVANYHGVTIGQINGVAQSAGTWATASMYNNATEINLWEVPTGGGTIAGIALDSSASMTISGFYQTA
jgi:hypothetical protein